MARPLIALVTDFGLRDHYVGAMKGVILGICPEATLVDISNEIDPQDILGGALELAASYQHFPSSTIFLVVVDPGVGSARRAVAVESGGYRFVGPDNGVFSLVVDPVTPNAVELTDPQFARPTVSRTFEGRDRFAPAAAWLANGTELTALGRRVSSLVRLDLPLPQATADRINGEVLRIDRFGNLTTNIDAAMLLNMAPPITVSIGPQLIPRIVSTYADVQPGELCALLGSSDRLEIAVSGGSAARTLGLGRGAVVQLRRGA